jgi:hypothetical protein
MYCNDHMLQANALYAQYKAANAVALSTFADDALDKAIALRQEYARRFLDYEDTGAHSAYIAILQRVRAAPCAASPVAPCAASPVAPCAASSVAPCAASPVAPCAASSVAPCAASSVAPCAAYRRTAYNRWMTDSAYFSDFKRIVGLRSVAVGNL